VKSYYSYNGHGDVVQLTNASGTVARDYRYDAFGVEQGIDVNDTNPFRYCGEYYDAEAETYYLRARYYSPKIGRFTQADTFGGYANNAL
jgi:RHS repeat-associated protein